MSQEQSVHALQKVVEESVKDSIKDTVKESVKDTVISIPTATTAILAEKRFKNSTKYGGMTLSIPPSTPTSPTPVIFVSVGNECGVGIR